MIFLAEKNIFLPVVYLTTAGDEPILYEKSKPYVA